MKTILTLLTLTISLHLVAQDNNQIRTDTNKTKDLLQAKDSIITIDTLAVNPDDKSYFKAQMSFTSNYSYYGRTNVNAIPYLAPYLGYFNKNGFFVSTSLYYSLTNQSKIETYMIDIGYDYEVNKKLTLGAFANKTNYNNSSSIVSSSVKGFVGGYIDYDFNYFEITLDSEVLLSKKADLNFTPTLYREFEMLKNKSLKITPTVLANFSSLHYYEDYSNKKIKKNSISQTSTSVETVVNNNRFTLLDYEFSVPVEYRLYNFVFFATPMFAIPIHPVYTTSTYTLHTANGVQIGNPITVDSTEASELNLKNKFFVEVGLYYKF